MAVGVLDEAGHHALLYRQHVGEGGVDVVAGGRSSRLDGPRHDDRVTGVDEPLGVEAELAPVLGERSEDVFRDRLPTGVGPAVGTPCDGDPLDVVDSPLYHPLHVAVGERGVQRFDSFDVRSCSSA